MRAPSSSLTLVIWGTCSNLSRVRFRTLISSAVTGWHLGTPVFSHLQASRVLSCAGPRATDQ
jgi:hypothetical protein